MLVRLVYPPQCLTCAEWVQSDFGLCPTCWRDTPFVGIGGTVCDLCGMPVLPDPDAGADDPAPICDDCTTLARPWSRGRTALLYRDNACRIVLGLKHGDRQDYARPAARWMARAAGRMLVGPDGVPETPMPPVLLAPIPLHWRRMLKRRYNQAALLALGMGRLMDLPVCPDLLRRTRSTRIHQGLTATDRFANMQDAIAVTPRHRGRIKGATVLLVDDVMTSGATLAAAADACLSAGATDVLVQTLARVAKGD